MKRIIRLVVNLVLICSLLLPVSVVNGFVALHATNHETTHETSGLFRVTVEIRQEYDLIRLKEMKLTVLSESEQSATLLVSSGQLESLAKLGFLPQTADDLNSLVMASAEDHPWLADSLRPSLERASISYQSVARISSLNTTADEELVDILSTFSIEQLNGISYLPGVDSDGDGLTDTQESWWCTDPMNPDSDGDGKTDGEEIQAIKDWMANKSAQPPGETPWPDWPFNSTTCPDKDFDSIPNLVEKYELGLNMDLESTDYDKFDDGQEVFGVTYCPGGDNNCGYGDLPRSGDAGYVGQVMPTWVKSPGNHPMVAAFPEPKVMVVPSSLKVETVTTITTTHEISAGEQRSYSTSETNGTSSSVSNTVVWNEWQEFSESFQETILNTGEFDNSHSIIINGAGTSKIWTGSLKIVGGLAAGVTGCVATAGVGCAFAIVGAAAAIGEGIVDIVDGRADNIQEKENANKLKETEQFESFPADHDNSQDICPDPDYSQSVVMNQGMDSDNLVSALQGTQLAYLQTGQAINQRLYEISNILAAPKYTETTSTGNSHGGEQSNTTEEYQELQITNGEAFSSEESWGIATAVDSSHAADLWFSYTISNEGTEYAREIKNIAFNVYLNNDPNPIVTYFVSADIGGDGVLYNLLPGETHTFTARRIPLSLEQMKLIDLGGRIRIEHEDLSFGADELFYQNAINANLQVVIEDGIEDGDETMDRYLIPFTTGDSITDVLGRYFPTSHNSAGNLIAIWTPEYRNDSPEWCNEPEVVGSGTLKTVWCKHAVSVMDWWQVYLGNLGDGSSKLDETEAVQGGTVLLRFNSDSDLDGYSDRAEMRLGTDPENDSDFPAPNLIAGLHSIRTDNEVVATLSLMNTGLSDAYGVEAIMIAPDDTITITNNTVGGSGRVKALGEVVVGSRILNPTINESEWEGSAMPVRSGYYSGITDKTYVFTVTCEFSTGCEVGQNEFSLSWTDGVNSGEIDFSAEYQSPSVLQVGEDGLEISLLSGNVFGGNSFIIEVWAPRDTFKYTINTDNYTAPIVLVTYNDPRGNHRIILPPEAMSISAPSQDLLDFNGTMIPIKGVEIVTTQAFQPGVNAFHLSVENPTQSSIVNGKLHNWIIANDGTIVLKQTITETFQPGPNIIEVDFDTSSFLPIYDPSKTYITLAHWTDYEDNILDVTGRNLSNFQEDPKPVFSTNIPTMVWNFGQVQKGVMLEHDFVLANEGLKELSVWVSAGDPQQVLEAPEFLNLLPGETAGVPLTLDTALLEVGQYNGSITIRTNDIEQPEMALQIIGEILIPTDGITSTGNQNEPLTEILYVHGPIAGNSSIDYLNSNELLENSEPILFSNTAAVIKGFGEEFIGIQSEAFAINNDLSRDLNERKPSSQIDLSGATELEEYRTESSRVYIWPDGRGTVVMDNPLHGENEINDRTYGGMKYDAYVNSYYPNTATWNQKLLWLGYNPGSYKENARILIWFNLPGLPPHAIVDQAQLELHINSCNGGCNNSRSINTQIFRITGSWSQGNYEPTWNNHPPVDWGTVWSSKNITDVKQFKYWDVTNLVKTWYAGTPNYGMLLRANPQNASGFSFYAHENLSNVPQLIIDFHIPPPPNAPTLYAISNGDADGNYTVDWSDTPNTTSYQLQENLNGGAFTDVYSGAASYWNATNRGVGYRCYRVRAVNAYGASGYSGTQCTTINPAPGIPVINPIDNSDGDGNYTVSWNSVQYATSYELQESHESGAYATVYSGGNLSHSITGRTMGQWCYRVRANNASGTGGWSVPQCVMVNIPPNPPINLLPATGANVLGRAVMFSWTNGGDPDNFPGQPMNYQVEIIPANGAATIESPVLTDTQWIGIVPADGEYTWRVKAYDGSSWGNWSVTNQLGVYSIERVDASHTTIAIPETIDDYTHYIVSYGLPARFAQANTSELLEIRLPKRIYASVTFDMMVKSANDGNVNFSVDIGDDSTVEWSQLLAWTEPVTIGSPNLAPAINAIMLQSPQVGGELVSIPIRVSYSSVGDLFLYNLVGQAGVDSDPMIGNGDISITNPLPVETDILDVTARVHNIGIYKAKNIMAAFFVGDPTAGGKYIGSKLIPQIEGESYVDATIQWNTSGFTGEQTVFVILDRADQIVEMDEENNIALKDFYILTRPDLMTESLDLSDREPVLNETVSLSFSLVNNGEADSTESKVAVYDGERSKDGVLVGEGIAEVIGQSATTMTFDWTPTTFGLHRLFVYTDIDEQINEFDESNNVNWLDVYVGLAGPVKLDSGTANDPMYVPELGYGYIDINQPDEIVNCGNLPEQTMRRDPDGEIVYKFDHLLPGHFYHLDITLYECDGAGRQQSIHVDDNKIAGPIDLGDGTVHRLSLRIDPALYADREIKVSIMAEGIDGAVVSEVNLFDIDYRYADAGGNNDPQYPGEENFGWLDGSAVTAWGTLPYQSVRVDQTDSELRYRFDDLNPEKRYNVHFTFWQPSGMPRIMKVQVDGVDTELTVNTGDYLRHQESIAIPLSAYSSDGSVIISIIRTNASTGAMVNEIALEEETITIAHECNVPQTPYFSETYGDVLVENLAAPVGSVVEAVSPRGDTVGCFVVQNEGQYGFMRIYGEDATANPAIPGMRAGEIVTYKVNGAPAIATPTFYWEDDHTSHNVNLNAGVNSNQSILLQPGWNLISFNVEPPTALVPSVLQSITGRYDRVLGEEGVHVPTIPSEFNTLKELHATNGYYVRITGSTSVNLLVDGLQVPCNQPKELHAGWNWIGAPCSVTPTATALASIEGQYLRIMSLSKTYDPALPGYSTLLNLTPGEGYLIFVPDPVTLVYPLGTHQIEEEVFRTNETCESITKTPLSTMIYGELNWNGLTAREGMTVKFLTPRGEVAGCSVVGADGIIPITQLYGSSYDGEPGFLDGELILAVVNGVDALISTELIWHDDKAVQQVSISAIGHELFIPLMMR